MLFQSSCLSSTVCNRDLKMIILRAESALVCSERFQYLIDEGTVRKIRIQYCSRGQWLCCHSERIHFECFNTFEHSFLCHSSCVILGHFLTQLPNHFLSTTNISFLKQYGSPRVLQINTSLVHTSSRRRAL